MSDNPLVSIIISVLNGERYLQACIDSVLSQTYPNIELIIMDGQSTDNTIEILESNSPKISYWESKPDNGIYDAWNKALLISNGIWVCFIGCDDTFTSKYSIDKLIFSINSYTSNACLISGYANYINDNGESLKIVGEKWNWNRFKYNQTIAHSGMLQKKILFDIYGNFDISFEIAGDYDFLYRLSETTEAIFVDEIIVDCGINGVSNKRIHKAFFERLIIHNKYKRISFLLSLWLYLKSYLIVLFKPYCSF